MATPLPALSQGYSPAAVGALLALFALTQVFLALPAGRFADRHDLRLPIAYSVLAAVAVAGAAAAFPVPGPVFVSFAERGRKWRGWCALPGCCHRSRLNMPASGPGLGTCYASPCFAD